MGDARTHEYSCVLRAVSSTDGMTADFSYFKKEFLSETSNKIINEVKGINRVLFDITSKPLEQLSGSNSKLNKFIFKELRQYRMYCLKIVIPEEICKIDDELKAIYHSRDTVCIWVFKTRDDRNNFMEETKGMVKADENHYNKNYAQIL